MPNNGRIQQNLKNNPNNWRLSRGYGIIGNQYAECLFVCHRKFSKENKKISSKQDYRINERIRSDKVRLVDENGENVGIVAIETALSRANEAGLDLVEIAPNADPPVVKIINFSKFL